MKIFEARKLSWQDLLTLLAISLSGVAYCQTNRINSPLPTVQSLKPRQYWSCNRGEERWNFTSVLPFIITNNGGRAISLVELHNNPGWPTVQTYTADGRAHPRGAVLFFPNEAGQESATLDELSPEDLDSHLTDERRVFVNYESAPPDFSVRYNQIISGAPVVQLNITLKSDTAEDVAYFEVVLDFEFSSGQTITQRTRLDPQKAENRDCP
jgi:hypothetical protein